MNTKQMFWEIKMLLRYELKEIFDTEKVEGIPSKIIDFLVSPYTWIGMSIGFVSFAMILRDTFLAVLSWIGLVVSFLVRDYQSNRFREWKNKTIKEVSKDERIQQDQTEQHA